MPFTVEEFQDLLRLLEERPEWRAQLRRHVLTDDLLELPDVVRELVQAQQRTEQRVEELAQAQQRTEQRVEELAQAQRRTEQQLEELAKALAALAAHVGALGDRVGAIEGELLEWRYERRAPAYFGPLARKLRVVDRSTLADMLDDAVDGGRLLQSEREAVLAADLVLSGQRREDRVDAYFLIEVSVGIGAGDVARAAERAGILAKLGRSVVPVVAGQHINEPGRLAAENLHVRQVLDGHAVANTDL